MISPAAIPSASDLDYTDIRSVNGYRSLLTDIYQREGGFAYPPRDTALTREMRRQGRIWLREVKTLIEKILSRPLSKEDIIPDSSFPIPDLGNIPPLLAGYDLLHRICHSAPCFDFIRRVRLRTADLRAAGDHSITRTDVALMLLDETDRDARTLPARYVRYAISEMASWIAQLEKHGAFPGIPADEARRRLRYLLRTDLFAFMDKDEEVLAKSRWQALLRNLWQQKTCSDVVR